MEQHTCKTRVPHPPVQLRPPRRHARLAVDRPRGPRPHYLPRQPVAFLQARQGRRVPYPHVCAETSQLLRSPTVGSSDLGSRA